MPPYVGSRYVDTETVKRSLVSYNRVIHEKYVTSASCVTEENDSKHVNSPTNVCELCNSHCGVLWITVIVCSQCTWCGR